MELLYFAWVRERIGKGSETFALPADVKTVAALLDHLTGLGPGYSDALADRAAIRVAVNHTYVGALHPVGADDEVAIFPPVTGG